MAGSLFDQMIKAGLMNKQKAKKIKKDKYQQSKNKKGSNELSDAAKHIELKKQVQAEQVKKLNLERKAQQEKKSLQAEVYQLIESNQIKDFSGKESYSFIDGATVKTLNIKASFRKKIISESLRIASFKGSYALIPAEVATKIIQRDESVLISLAVDSISESISDADKDYYAKFKVPDDLIW